MRKNDKAVTLIELLIASSIFVIVMVSIYSTFHTGLFGYRDIEENIDTYQAARIILERLSRDLRNSFVYSPDETMFLGKANEISFLTLADNFKENEFLRNYSFVSYILEQDKILKLSRKGQTAFDSREEIEPQELAANIENLNFSYGFIESDSQDLKWKDSWEEKNSLPLAVRAKLIIAGKTKQEFVRTIYFP